MPSPSKLDLIPFSQVIAMGTPLFDGVTPRTIERWSKKGQFPRFVRVGHQPPLWDRSAVQAFLDTTVAKLGTVQS